MPNFAIRFRRWSPHRSPLIEVARVVPVKFSNLICVCQFSTLGSVPFLTPEGKEKFFVAGDAALVNHPFQPAAVAEAILIDFGGVARNVRESLSKSVA